MDLESVLQYFVYGIEDEEVNKIVLYGMKDLRRIPA